MAAIHNWGNILPAGKCLVYRRKRLLSLAKFQAKGQGFQRQYYMTDEKHNIPILLRKACKGSSKQSMERPQGEHRSSCNGNCMERLQWGSQSVAWIKVLKKWQIQATWTSTVSCGRLEGKAFHIEVQMKQKAKCPRVLPGQLKSLPTPLLHPWDQTKTFFIPNVS